MILFYVDLVGINKSVTDPTRRQGEHEAALLKLLAHYRLEAARYYVLRRIESHFRMRLNETLRSFLSDNERAPNDGTPVALNDLGDMWPNLWGYR